MSTTSRPAPPPVARVTARRADASTALSVVVAFGAAMAAAMRAQFGPGVTVCLVFALVLAPVWITHLRRYRFARPLILLGAAAAIAGVLLTQFETARATSTSLMISETMVLLSFLSSIGLLLWARATIGTGWTVAAFGVGGLANLALIGVDEVNAWKYSLAIPVTLALLGLAMVRGSRTLEVIVLVAAAGVSAVSDSRSMTAFLLLAAALVVWQGLTAGPGRIHSRPWRTILGLAALGLCAFLVFQALVLEGVLGQAAAERTQAQINTSGSLIAGGRPEMGATAALLTAQPWGYGSGVLPTPNDVLVAKTGMSTLNYNPNNGYVERFMFGGHVEVHSVLGDLWIHFGPVGALFSLAVFVVGVYATARAVSLRTASAALIFLTALGAWDTFFSPLLTSYPTLALMTALALAASKRGSAEQRRSAQSRNA